MASWGSYVFELCRINANQGLTAEIDWNYTSWSRRCRKILIGLGKVRISGEILLG